MSRSIVNRATCAFNRTISAGSGVTVDVGALPSGVTANWPFASTRTQFVRSAAAQTDLIDILAWTHEHFGDAARKRYEALIVAALRDVSAQPNRPGSIERPELGDGVRS